jgi:hypothetical protein
MFTLLSVSSLPLPLYLSLSFSPTLTVDEFLLRDNTVVVDIQGLEELDGPGTSMRNYMYRETFSSLMSGGGGGPALLLALRWWQYIVERD